MKINKDNIKSILLIAFFIILIYASIWNLSAVFSWLSGVIAMLNPIIIGICIAFILNIIMTIFEERVFFKLRTNDKNGVSHAKLCRTLSILTALILFFGTIVLFLLVIIPQMTNAAKGITAGFPAFTERALAFIKERLVRFGVTSERISEILLGGEHIMTSLGNFAKDNMNTLFSSVRTISSSVITVFMNTFFGIFLAIYILFQKDLVIHQCRRLMRALFKADKYERISHILHISNKAFANFVSGQFIEACILGFLCFIGMLIFRFPYAPIVSVVVAVTALIPIIGAWIGGAISAFLILIDSPAKAIWFLVFFSVLQQLENNLIYPRVVGKKVGLPGVWVLCAVLIGNSFIGAIGALVAVPISTVIYTLLSEFVSYREQMRKLS